MRDLVDLHMHTIASGHAYNTINEMTEAGAGRGLEIMAITEHAPKMPGSCTALYFVNMKVLPRERFGIKVLHGAELNLIDLDGNVDLSQDILSKLDLGIVSMHPPCMKPGTKEENTRALLKAIQNPYINIIGHPDDGRFPLDYKALAEGAKEYGVLIEVNNSSLAPNSYRPGAEENNRILLEYCKQYEVPVVMDSDAHVDIDVANHSLTLKLLQEVNFPEKLIANANPKMLENYLNYYKR